MTEGGLEGWRPEPQPGPSALCTSLGARFDGIIAGALLWLNLD